MGTVRSITTRGIAAFLLCAAMVACGGPLRYAPHGTAKAPEADAEIVADVNEDSGFTRINLKVEHLAPPGRILAGGTTYVVWARQSDGAPWQRIGALAYDEEKRRGDLMEASVPLIAFALIVSAEKSSGPPEPSEDVVVAQEVNK
ncbi:MAG: hypothetical protein HUU21_37065 [Polyangiaceae bacterium]|nr:hypothetical protein [Polyangiaceae bacterium]NUQ79159.1 hypothetical protein [Polyangiaceae bacterium]